VNIDPTSVPALVALHQDYLRGQTYRAYMRTIFQYETATKIQAGINRGTLPGDTPVLLGDWKSHLDEHCDAWCTKQANLLNIATLFHVTEPMLAVAIAAARKLDDTQDVWTEDVLPARSGVLVFERPLYHLDARGNQIGTTAVTWNIFDMTTEVRGHRRNIEFDCYSDSNDTGDSYSATLRDVSTTGVSEQMDATRLIGRWQLTDTAAMKFGWTLGPMELGTDQDFIDLVNTLVRDTGETTTVQLTEPDDVLVSYPIVTLNVHRVLYAIFLLMQQSVAELEDWTDKRLARRIRGKRRPPPMVTVIRLRHPERHGARDEGSGTWLAYRSQTRGHWRRQNYADGSVQRIWIHAYWRGPVDAPIFQPKRVTTLQR
jgi:hypothetical protein